MDSGSGHIFNQDKINIKDITGKLVPWEVGEEIIVKECKFRVEEIKVFPDDLIILRGQPFEMLRNLEESKLKIDEFQKKEVLKHKPFYKNIA